MSRHRNYRNMTEDDYYDDYDDYDDDYYEEEEDDDYYYEQQKQRREREQAEQQKQRDIKAKAKPTGKQQQQATSTQSTDEKERLLQGLGYSPEQSKAALASSNGDVQLAASMLLSSGPSGAPPTATTATTSAAPSVASSRGTSGNSSGVSKPPPGFAKPPPPTVAPPTQKPSTLPNTSAGKSTTTTSITVAAAPTSAPQKQSQPPQKDYGPMPKISSDILNQIHTQRSRLSMVVLGHVDAGKSTLMGQVLLQMGQVQKRMLAKFEKQSAEMGKASFALAWFMDEDESERERGVTMDVGTKTIATTHHDVVILDAPGHADFVPAMITGAASADVGILVVAATPGEFESGFKESSTNSGVVGGQTREHIILARGLGVSQLIVAVNKLDAAEPQWSQQRYEEIKTKLLPFMVANGLKPKRIRFVPLSGLNGINVKEKPTTASVPKLASWYTGPTLLEAIDTFEPAKRNSEKPLRVILTDVYVEGKGVTTRGRVVQGVVQASDKLVVLPIGDQATATRIEHGALGASSSDSPIDRNKYATAGDTVEIVLNGIDVARVSPGCILSHPHLSLRPPVKRKCVAKILVMEQLGVPIIRGATALMHMHSLDIPTVLSKLVSVNNRDGSVKKERPRVLPGGASATVEMTLQERICMERYTDCRALGRFVLRRGGDTIALGIIETVL